MSGAAERELDHVGLAHDDPKLPAQPRDQWPVTFPRVRRQSQARPGETGIAGGSKQVLDRDGQALQRANRHPGGKGSIGCLGNSASLLRRPMQVGMEALAKALVASDGCLDQFPSRRPLLAQIARDFDQRTGEQITRHAHLLSKFPGHTQPG
jgi:hypothetical protein